MTPETPNAAPVVFGAAVAGCSTKTTRAAAIKGIDYRWISGIVNHMIAVQEHISHGDYQADRYIESDLSVESVTEMLNSCSYLKLPDFSDSGIVLTSRTRAEVLASRATDAKRVARELADTGVSEIGWVEYRIMDAIMEAAALRSAGWDTDKILRCE